MDQALPHLSGEREVIPYAPWMEAEFVEGVSPELK